MFKHQKSILRKAFKTASAFAGVFVLCAALTSCSKNIALPLGNSANYGYALVDGNDIYYSKTVEDEVDSYSCIYKYDMQTEKDTLVSIVSAEEDSVMNSFLTIDGGKLYFLSNYFHESSYEAALNINYIDLKSSEPNDVSTIFESDEISCRYMQIVNGMIYYYDDMEEIIYRMNVNGANRKEICEAFISSCSNMCVVNNKIYYSEYEIIYEVNVRGGTPKIIFDTSMEFEDDSFDIGYLIVDGGYIYYMDYDKYFIQRVSINGTGNTMIYKAPDGTNIESFNVSDGVVYFVLSSGDIYTISSIVPGTQNARTVVDSSHGYADILPLSIWGDSIYYLALPAYETIMDSDFVWFKTKKTGGQVTPLRPFMEFLEAFGSDLWNDEYSDIEDEDIGENNEDEDEQDTGESSAEN